jgi:hypothetical protein
MLRSGHTVRVAVGRLISDLSESVVNRKIAQPMSKTAVQTTPNRARSVGPLKRRPVAFPLSGIGPRMVGDTEGCGEVILVAQVQGAPAAFSA